MAYHVLHVVLVLLWCAEVFTSAYLSLATLNRALTDAWNALAVAGLLPGLASLTLMKWRSGLLIVGMFAGANLALGAAMLAESESDHRRQMRDERTRIPSDELKQIENAVAPTLFPTAPTFEALQASRKVVQQLVKEAHAQVALAMDEPADASVKTDRTLAAMEKQIEFFHTDLGNRDRVRGELRRRIAPRIEQMDRRLAAWQLGKRGADVMLGVGAAGILGCAGWLARAVHRRRAGEKAAGQAVPDAAASSPHEPTVP